MAPKRPARRRPARAASQRPRRDKPVSALARTKAFDVTVVERGATVRPGGLPIDLRGSAIEVSKRMGLHDQVVAENVGTRRYTWVNEAGEVVTTMVPSDLMGDDQGSDVELARDRPSQR